MLKFRLPIQKQSTLKIIEELSSKGIICNITAIFTLNQLEGVVKVLDKSTPAILSIFAGRIADTGTDPSEIMKKSIQIASNKPNSEILWAKTREVLNIFQADKIGCQIITVPHSLLNKLSNLDKNLEDFSLETVKDFYTDAVSAGFKIKI